jgi:hypothetical protein
MDILKQVIAQKRKQVDELAVDGVISLFFSQLTAKRVIFRSLASRKQDGPPS